MGLFDGILDDTGAQQMPPQQGNPPGFGYFGKYADTFKKEGWFPESDPDKSNGAIIYRNPHDAAFNIVDNPKEKAKAHVAIIGYPNKTFDVVIRDSSGKVLKKTMEGISADAVNNYMTNTSSTVAQRDKKIREGTNSDRYDNGNYLSLN